MQPKATKPDSGFTLAELMVAIVIVFVLVAAAVPAFSHQRNRAFDAAVKSDLRNAAMIAEANVASAGYADEHIFAESDSELVTKGTRYVGYADADSYVVMGQSRSGRVFTIGSRTPLTQVDAGGVVTASGPDLLAAGAPTLPGYLDPPPAGIQRPYAAAEWGRDDAGEFSRQSAYFGVDSDDPAGPGPGAGGGVPVVGAPGEAVLEYDLRLPGCTAHDGLTLPFHETGSDFEVDWGDGTVNGERTHVYDELGPVTITARGGIPSFSAAWPATDDSPCLSRVVRFHAQDHQTHSMASAFFLASNLTSLGDFDTTGVRNMTLMFAWTESFNEPLDLETSSVTQMEAMFEYARAFNSPLRLSDTSNVRSMRVMFRGATAFNQPLRLDGSALQNAACMFAGAHAFNSTLELTNTGNLQTVECMFADARSFNQPLDLDLRTVTSFVSMFDGASAFNQDLSAWNVSPTASSQWFSRGSALTPQHMPAFG